MHITLLVNTEKKVLDTAEVLVTEKKNKTQEVQIKVLENIERTEKQKAQFSMPREFQERVVFKAQ